MTAIETILKEIENLGKKIDILDRNVKQLMNQRMPVPRASAVPSVSTTPLTPEEEDLFSFKSNPGPVHRPKTIKVFGYVQRTGGIPIPDVVVTVWDNDDKEVMKRITSVNGYWEGRLPAGKYALEYSGDNVRPVNKVILIDDTMDKLEIV